MHYILTVCQSSLFGSLRTSMLPRRSDVTMRSLRWHTTPVGGPYSEKNYTTLQAMQAFHVNRVDWIYTTSPEFYANATAMGVPADGSINANLPDTGSSPATYEVGRVVDVHGNKLTAPWMRSWKVLPYYGCINNPAYRNIVFTQVRALLQAGSAGIQHDDPRSNGEVVTWKPQPGCFCDYCMANFTPYLMSHLNATQRAAYNVTPDFNFREWTLAHQGSPSAVLNAAFLAFQQESVRNYVSELHEVADACAGHHVTLSGNNGGRWDTPLTMFDFGLGEMSHEQATPDLLNSLFIGPPKPQMMTMPKRAGVLNRSDTELTQKTIAYSYAIGGNIMVPWDIYMPGVGSARYFGNATDFAPLYKFIRDNAVLFDDYDLATASAQPSSTAAYVSVNSSDVYALPRRKPAAGGDPVAVHVVNWAYPAVGDGMTRLQLNNTAFYGSTSCDALSFTLHSPFAAATPVKATSCTSGINVLDISTPNPWLLVEVTPVNGSSVE